MKLLNGKINPRGEEGVPVTNSIAYFLELFQKGVIQSRPHNRGKVGIDKSKVEAICRDFSASALMTLGLIEKVDGSYELFDGHTRMAAIMLRASRDILTKKEKDYQLTVLVYNSSLADDNYAKVNSGIPHGGLIKLTDESRILGYTGSMLQKKSQVEIKPKLNAVFWDCILAAKDHAEEPTLKALKLARKQVANKNDGLQDRGLNARSLQLSQNIRDNVDKGLQFYKTICGRLEEVSSELGAGSMKKVLARLPSQAGLFTAIMSDALSEDPLLTSLSPLKVADRCVQNVNKILSGSANLAKRDSTTPDNVRDFFKNLGIKSSDLDTIVKRYCGVES